MHGIRGPFGGRRPRGGRELRTTAATDLDANRTSATAEPPPEAVWKLWTGFSPRGGPAIFERRRVDRHVTLDEVRADV